MTLLDCIKTLMDRNDNIRLDDGANTWDLGNLYDAVAASENHDEKYSIQPDGIYILDSNGYLAPAYRIRDQLRESMQP